MSGRRAVPQRERGMILVNVLIIVMLATAVLAIMLAGEEDDVERTVMLRQAAQGLATARGAELSAIAALRRDGAAGTTSDSLDEEWARIGDSNARIDGGTFSFAVADAQALYNINNLTRGDANIRSNFTAIAAEAGIASGVADRIAEGIGLVGPIGDLADTRLAGVNDQQLRRLATLVTVLPEPTDVNLNTAPEDLIAVLFRNRATAAKLVSLRNGRGGLDAGQMLSNGLGTPLGTGFTSNYFWSRGRVVMGTTSQQLTSLLHRGSVDGTPVVVAVRRWRGAAPVMAPPLPAGSGGKSR